MWGHTVVLSKSLDLSTEHSTKTGRCAVTEFESEKGSNLRPENPSWLRMYKLENWLESGRQDLGYHRDFSALSLSFPGAEWTPVHCA